MSFQATHTTLSTEQLDALLVQPKVSTTTLAQHPELAALRSAFADLRVSSLNVAEQHQNHAYRARIKSSRSFGAFATAWGALATAVVVCAIAIPLALHRHPQPIASPNAVAAASPTSGSTTSAATDAAPHAASNVSDEVLLADVQADLNDSVPSAMLPLTTSSETTSTTQRTR